MDPDTLRLLARQMNFGEVSTVPISATHPMNRARCVFCGRRLHVTYRPEDHLYRMICPSCGWGQVLGKGRPEGRRKLLRREGQPDRLTYLCPTCRREFQRARELMDDWYLLVCPSCGTQAQIGPVTVMERDPFGRYHSAAALKWRAEHKEPPLQQQPEYHSLRPDYRSRLRHDPTEGIWLVCL